MDPHFRQALKAPDDYDNKLADDFFNELVLDGEKANDEDIEFEFSE